MWKHSCYELSLAPAVFRSVLVDKREKKEKERVFLWVGQLARSPSDFAKANAKPQHQRARLSSCLELLALHWSHSLSETDACGLVGGLRVMEEVASANLSLGLEFVLHFSRLASLLLDFYFYFYADRTASARQRKPLRHAKRAVCSIRLPS